MEKDMLTHMAALTTRAGDMDSATAQAGAPSAVQTALKDAALAANNGVNVEQESMGPREGDEMEKISDLSLCASVEAEAPCPQAPTDHRALREANGQGNSRKKKSRKRRNKRESKLVYLPWPLTLQTRASSAAPVLGHACVRGPLPDDSVEVGVADATGEQSENGERENTSVLTEPWDAPVGALLPAASPSPEGGSQEANGEIKVGQKNSRKGRNKKNKKIMASPWPLTVQVWASYMGPGQLPAASVGASEVANDGVYAGLGSRGQKDEEDEASVVTSYQSAQEGSPCSAVALDQPSWEEASFAKDEEHEGKTGRHKKRNRKDKNDLSCPWPLTVHAWAAFTAADPVQTVLQGESPAAGTAMIMGQKSWPQLETSKEETKSILPSPVTVQAGAPSSATAPGQPSVEGAHLLEDVHSKLSQTRRRPKRADGHPVQSSAEQSLEPSLGCRNVERHAGDRDFRDCTVMNFSRQVDCCYCGELCSQERMKALTLTQAHTHISTSVLGMQGQERERAESQAACAGKWEDF